MRNRGSIKSRAAAGVAILAVVAVVALAAWRTVQMRHWQQRQTQPLLMGTFARFVAVGSADAADAALADARRRVDLVIERMDRHNPASEISRFNAAPPGQRFALTVTDTVMQFNQQLAERTGGAFDQTMWPMGQLWKQSADQGRLPTPEQIAEVAGRVGYRKLDVHLGRGDDSYALKTVAGMQVSLDATAKGYAVDLAIEALKARGLRGGLVDIGGDIRCFGRPAPGDRWTVGVQDPWRPGKVLMTVAPLGEELAICTSGNYERFVTIDGRHYSHIIDPRTGQPADAIPSVTVIAPTTMVADGWATALSVLGVEGLALIEHQPGVEALIVTGSPQSPRFHFSSGFEKHIISR